jgi:hypothetical protein
MVTADRGFSRRLAAELTMLKFHSATGGNG